MRPSVFLPVFVPCAVALQSLSGYIGDLPSCSINAFKSALTAEDCYDGTVDSNTFDCMCAKIPGVTSHIASELPDQCLEDWTGAYGGICGVYEASSTSASGWAQATSLLAKEFGGSGGTDTAATKTTGSGSSPTNAGGSSSPGAASPTLTTSGGSSPTDAASSASGDAASPSSTSSEDAGPTIMPKLLSVVGGAAGAIGLFFV